MEPIVIILIITFLITDFVLIGGMIVLAAWSRANRPEEVGNGRLGEKEGKPNYVSSRARQVNQKVEPLRFEGDENEAWITLGTIIEEMEKTEIITATDRYLHAECRSPLFGFRDDLELELMPGANRIEIRSASRIGYYDMNANRHRVELIRKRFAKA